MSLFSRKSRSRAPEVPETAPQVLGFYAIYVATFFFTFSYGLSMYLLSSYVENSIGKQGVGLVFVAGAVIALFCLIKIPPFLRRFGDRKTALFLLTLILLSFFGLAFFQSPKILILLVVLEQALVPLIVFNLDLFLESFSQDSSTGKIRGAYLTAINLALFIAPFTAGLIFIDGNYWRIFIFSAIVTFLPLFLVFFSLRTFQDPPYIDISFSEAFRHLREKLDIRHVLGTRFLLRFFYAWMTIYLPIFLHIEIGFSLTEIIGVIFPIALLPFILLELPLGKLADQRHDEKELLSLGFLILALSTGSIAFITSQNIFVWAGVLFLGRIGAALVEVASATYFFKKVNASNTNLISMFRSLNPMATIAAPLVATSFLFAFDMSYRYLFVILALILLVGMPISKRLQRISND